MKAAIYEGAGPLVIKDIPKPVPGPEEAVIKVKTCGICHTDVSIITGKYPPRHPAPLILGHEIAGIVDAAGENVRNSQPGDRVLVSQCVTCGYCDRCKEGRQNLCQGIKTLGLDTHGGYSEYFKIPARNLIKIPDNISFAEGSIISSALATAYHAVRRLNLERGESVAIFGSGVLGLNAVQITSKIFGAKVIAIDTEDWKLELALAKGAWKTLKVVNGMDTSAVLKEEFGEIDTAMEFIGLPETYGQAIECVRRGGRVILVGATAQPITVSPQRMFKDEVAISGSYASIQSEIPYLIDMVSNNELIVKDMISHTFSLDEINKAVDMLANHREKSLRTVIAF